MWSHLGFAPQGWAWNLPHAAPAAAPAAPKAPPPKQRKLTDVLRSNQDASKDDFIEGKLFLRLFKWIFKWL